MEKQRKIKIALWSTLGALLLVLIAAGVLFFTRGGGNRVYLSPSAQDHNLYAGMEVSERQSMNALTDTLEPIIAQSRIVYAADGAGTLESYIEQSNGLSDVVHIALHSNATGREDSTTRGCEIYVRPGDWESRRLANCIYDKLSALTPDADRGVKTTSSLLELNSVGHTAILIEVDFHDNDEGAAWITQHYEEIAQAIADGVEAYMRGEARAESLKDTLKDLLRHIL